MLFSFFLQIDPHGRCFVYEMIRCCSNCLRWGGGVRDRNTAQTGDQRRRGGGNFFFHGAEIRGYSQKIRGYSLECPGGLTTSMLIHILICDIGGVFWTPSPNSARKTAVPIMFYVGLHPHPGGGSTAPLHFTPLSYFTASPRGRLYSC